MGWRDRDWAKFTEEEFRAIYGGSRPTPYGGDPRLRRVPYPAAAAAVVSAALMLATAVGVRALYAPASAPSAGGSAAAVIYGIPGTGAEPFVPGGKGTACTTMALHKSSGEWRCLTWTLNPNRVPVLLPRRYEGPCAHAEADQAAGAWRCLSAVALPESALPGARRGTPGSPSV